MVETKTTYLSPLHETISTTATDFWNDSCSIEELTYAIEHGAVGATSNPTIVEQVHRQERHLWGDRIHEIIQDNPSRTEEDIMWKVFEEIGVKGVELLLPAFEREAGKKGRMSIQTNPANYRNVIRGALDGRALATALGSAAIAVNATTVGMTTNTVAFDVAGLPEGALVFDLVYVPPITPLVRAATARGLHVCNGMEMLVRQGEIAFERWTGIGSTAGVMRSAFEAWLAD